MHWLDWVVLFTTLFAISAYGIWKTRGKKTQEDYLGTSKSTPWWAIGLSIMATQASAITFLSTPGMGYSSGLEFVQFYLGLPIAMVIVATVFVPRYHKLKVFTAFQFLEDRFDRNTRKFTAFLFLVQRGLAAGITIYAPSIILSLLLDLNLYLTILIIGSLVILYTVSGGTDAVTQTHKQQMAIIFLGMFIAFGYLVYFILDKTSWSNAMVLADMNNKLTSIKTTFQWDDKYNVWSGLIAGTFLMLSYFGTDQSQVQRYISGKDIKVIRTGLYFNAVLKIPMQYFILFTGVLVFIFYQYHQPPVHFDSLALQHLEQSDQADAYKEVVAEKGVVFQEKQKLLEDWNTNSTPLALKKIQEKELQLDKKIDDLLVTTNYASPVKKESDFVFITFVLDHLPIGLIGLLMAVIFSAAMSSTAAELNALGTTTSVDFYQLWKPNATNLLSAGKWSTALWGVVAIAFAMVAQFMDNLVEVVNILGSLFYGTVLGIFLVAFFAKYIQGKAVLWAAVVAELVVLSLFFFNDTIVEVLGTKIEFLWYNVIGCVLVFVFGFLFQILRRSS
jgi:SSS family solute:Na+ symporter